MLNKNKKATQHFININLQKTFKAKVKIKQHSDRSTHHSAVTVKNETAQQTPHHNALSVNLKQDKTKSNYKEQTSQ